MENFIKINDTLFLDLNNYHEQVDETEDLNIFEANHVEGGANYQHDAETSCKLEIKRYVDIFVELVKDKHVSYDISKKFKDSNLDIIRIIQAINNSHVKGEELHFARLMMIICLKNYISHYVNKYLKNIIKDYEKSKYKKEVKNFNCLIYSKGSGEVRKDTWTSRHQEWEDKTYSDNAGANFLFIKFLSEDICKNFELLENGENTSKHISEKEWAYLKDKILLLIKNSCVINCNENKKFSNLVEFINKNMYRSFKRHKSIVEMKKFNICLYFIDIFFNLFLIDYPFKWGSLLGDIFSTFHFISIYNSNDLMNVINGDYNSTLSCLTNLMKFDAAASQMENMKEGGNNEENNTHRVVIHFQNFYSLMFIMNKMVKKYIPKTQNNNSYSVLYHSYFISHINSSNKDFLENGEYSSLRIPCENLLSGFKDIIKIFFPIFNRLLCTLLNYMESIYVVFMVKKMVKFLYKTLLCHFSILPEELIKNELEILFTNIVNILDIDLDAYVHKLYFTNTSESCAKGTISVAKITEETSYENLSELIHNKDHNIDRLFLMILLKSKKWCLKILNMFLYRSIYFDEMNETWKALLKHFENKYIIFLEKISLLILKAIINTNYTDEERMHYDKLICYIRYVVDFTDYLNFADKCLSLSLNYLCMIVSFDHLQVFVKQNILSEAFLGCLFVHIGSISHVECVDNFFTDGSVQKEESLLFDNLKFERYIICFHKIPLYRKYLSDYYDDTKSKNVLKKYVNYIIFLFCELLDKYFYDVIFYLDANVKEHLRTCLVIQNEYMHVLYPDMFVKKEMDFSNDVVEISCYKKSDLLINAEMCMRTKNHNIYINSVISCISQIIQKHMRENDMQEKVDLSLFSLLNSDTFNSLIFIIKNFPLYKYSQEELIFKDLYSMHNKHNLNLSCLIMNDINLYKYFSLFMFLVYYKWVFIMRVLRGVIDEGVLLGGVAPPTCSAFAASGGTGECDALPTCVMTPTFAGSPSNQNGGRTTRETEDLTIDDYIEEYCKNKKKYKQHLSSNEKEIEMFDQIVTDFKIRDKSFFLNYMLVNIFHPYSNNLKRVIMWMLKEYSSMTKFSENILQFFFYMCFINLFYFEKHLKFKSFDTLINLMYKYGIPRQIFYNDFREIFTFLFFQLLILFIKNESNSHDNEFYEDNVNVLLSQNQEKRYLVSYLKGEDSPLFEYTCEKAKLWSSYLYNQVNCFTDFFINDVLYHNFQYYIEKMEVRNLNQFLNFISLFYQNEINNNIFLFINLLNESLLDTTSSYMSGSEKEHSSFLRALKFFSFFLEHYKNASSTQDVLIIKILQGEKFIAYFKNIVRTVKKNQVCEEILNEIYYILHIFTKNSLFNYKIFWFYFLYSVACISKSLNVFQLREVTKLEKVANIPVYLFQFFSNVIRRDVLYFFFTLAEEKPFSANCLNISLVEIFRKISLLLILLSEKNLNEQHFCNNSTLHICGLYLYNNLLFYLFMLLGKNKIFFTYLFWGKLRKAYELLQEEEGAHLSDMDDVVSNYSFSKFDEMSGTSRECNNGDFVFLDDEFLEGNCTDGVGYAMGDAVGDCADDASVDDPDADQGGGIYVEVDEEENEKNAHTSEDTMQNYSMNPKSLSSDLSFQKSDLNDSMYETETNGESWKGEVLFYKEMKNYFLNKKKKLKSRRKKKKKNKESNTNKCSHLNGGSGDITKNVHSNDSSHRNINGGDVNQSRENKIVKLLNTVYFNIFLLKDKKNEHIKMLLKTLKSINHNLVLNDSESEYHKYTMLLMLQKKRYIYQSLSLYVFMDIQDFFAILVRENILGSIIDEWLNDIFYIYQNSDDLKYFIFAFSNILIYLCMYEQKKRELAGCASGGEEEKGFRFLKSSSTTNSSMNNFDTILREIKLEFFDEYAIAQLRERLPRIINAVVNVFLILPIPYEENVKVFKKNILRRLAPICGEGDNIENNNLLKFNSDNSATDNLSATFKEIHFNDLLQNIEFMHLNKYEQKFYERNQNSLKFSYDNVVHINKSEDLILYDKKISINYYFQSSIHDDFVNRLVSECNDEHFKIALYARKAFSLLNQEFFSNDDLIGILGCSDKYYNFVNVIRLDI
ncbi:conserved Plasmodium protein, unknown function [Plasmodium knowlesi strain H]|uniref:Uncharacterized protein n=3 Tax=Plasmodium knowlesi TaxID=5850 RepID=A0A5K1V5W8_PLAKH|nr:conserved Plasmodium protein, unknown function [Plasmodium knowlesi strain H]OTN64401.1 Uncharacterized protein PKNOH_S130174600 [Plasmodium knowlesi]CAA9988914.1 conserved Plasmodium protein, unknown function [Plasmodium knowlesi strain H]SBO24759.1 conserved Plasmodium protein, unknown function [Plasmodium knowlesi strain H]SBO28023.1 conserved Plasmodium protein, unknown function [Plasmodium knowlesi strain H]VVS78388.1 conserved Plasmodium protein, unknown function [Plasmodium knowlesi |eukprot:XP_002261261.1 hypothetical protein, conserved in Plasmodium species [Plasmodium knowlesi strain H]